MKNYKRIESNVIEERHRDLSGEREVTFEVEVHESNVMETEKNHEEELENKKMVTWMIEPLIWDTDEENDESDEK